MKMIANPGKVKRPNVSLVILVTAIILTFPKRTYAYLDPGSGSYIIQMFAATLFASLYLVKKFWSNIKVFITGLFNNKTAKSVETLDEKK